MVMNAGQYLDSVLSSHAILHGGGGHIVGQ